MAATVPPSAPFRPGRRARSPRLVAGLAASLLLLGACSMSDGDSMSDGGEEPTTATTDQDASRTQTFEGTLAGSVQPDEAAVTYDEEAAPEGATMKVEVASVDDETTFALSVTGMEPDRGYAVHAHTMPCGATGDAAGPHYQDEKDPAATPAEPSSDPDYANPENEVWLDLETDADGAGTGEVTVPFTFDDAAPESIVIHADMETMTADGMAGMAGDRIACLDAAIEQRS